MDETELFYYIDQAPDLWEKKLKELYDKSILIQAEPTVKR